MPDLNLIEEEEFEEQSAPVAPVAKKKTKGGGGGGGRTILILLLVVIIAAAAVYFLNQRGVIKLWGKKQQSLAQTQEEPFQMEQFDQNAQAQKPADTSEVALLETPTLEEKAEPAKNPEAKLAAPAAKKSKEEAMESETASKLSEMKGEFTVQVIAYREKKKAIETSNNLEFAGYPSFVEKVPMKGGDWYTVRIGKYPTRDEAQKAVKTFAAQLQSHYVIDKVRGK
jgi:cell division protein FtsN